MTLQNGSQERSLTAEQTPHPGAVGQTEMVLPYSTSMPPFRQGLPESPLKQTETPLKETASPLAPASVWHLFVHEVCPNTVPVKPQDWFHTWFQCVNLAQINESVYPFISPLLTHLLSPSSLKLSPSLMGLIAFPCLHLAFNSRPNGAQSVRKCLVSGHALGGRDRGNSPFRAVM